MKVTKAQLKRTWHWEYLHLYPVGYHQMNVYVTDDFDHWMSHQKDIHIKTRVMARLRLAGLGSLGDSRSLKKGLHELRLHIRGGVRLYYFYQTESKVVLMQTLKGKK